ncbi:hypothetical protein AB0C93_23540 [Streptomyces sp. NPDC048518]|uniref:hypothetical protein n=1 Tax=Streptomyces sp. NPDC048518 TaxID=3155029 RepID=UPI0033C764D2
MDRWTAAKLVPVSWPERRGVLWGVVIAVWVVLYGALGLFWHFVLDHSWTEALVFTVVLSVVNGVVQWWALRLRQRTRRRAG